MRTTTVVLRNARGMRDTGLALFCEIPDPRGHGPARQVWVPQSQITDDSEVWRIGDVGNLVVTIWWARHHGFAAARSRHGRVPRPQTVPGQGPLLIA